MVAFLPGGTRGRLAALALGLSLAACAQGHRPDGSRRGGTDSGTVVPPDAGGGCPAGRTDCGGSCVDLQSDPANCGGCGIACTAGHVCSAGMCDLACGTGLEACGGSCRDLTNDPAHCGACDNACAAGELCMGGTCAASCPSGLTDCAGACRDHPLRRAEDSGSTVTFHAP